MKRKRNYNKEYNDYYGRGKAESCTPLQRKRRKEKSGRNVARSIMTKLYGKLPKHIDVGHIDSDPTNNAISNLKLQHRSENRNSAKERS